MNTCLIKISGKAVSSFSQPHKIKTWLDALLEKYDNIIIVHGAGKEITEWSDKFGIKSEFIDGQRVTNKEQMKIVSAVQGGLINSELCAKINAAGFSASGYSGIDRSTFEVKEFTPQLGFVGKPELKSSVEWINNLLTDKVIPVFSSICRDCKGNLVNVNADIFAETLAISLKINTVIFLSDVQGVNLKSKVEKEITTQDIISGIASGEITGGMIPKLISCASLLEKGIEKLWIGATLDSLIFTNNNQNGNNGTWITNNRNNYKKLKKTA